ncbi:MAG: hypothetical protein K2L03_05300, partial [Bacteroidales bacterium]|nr:hypothetical protein [Bacteroidales bacterium]
KFGADFADNTDLTNGFFVNDATTPYVSYTAITQTDPGFELGFDFNLCGKTMKYFTLCATGGIHFSEKAAVSQVPSAVWSSNSNQQNFVSVVVWDTSWREISFNSYDKQQAKPKSIAGQAPVMYLIEGEVGQKVLTVQYRYTVNGDEWAYQLKVHEGSNKVEFVADALNTDHIVQDACYNVLFGLVENANAMLKDDQFSILNLPNSDKPQHKIGFSNQDKTTGDWNTSTVYSPYTGIIQNADNLRVAPGNTPQSGYTLTLNPPADCAEKATPFEDAWYSFTTTGITKTGFSGQISLIKDAITIEDMMSVGTLVAVLSTSATPDYTLANGTWYKEGTKLNANSQVIYNKKPSYTTHDGNISDVSSTPISASRLTEATTYYVHFHAMDYRCTGAPVYSDCSRTCSFSTSIELPQTLTSGLPTTSAVPLTVKPADGLGMILLKSPNTNA